MALFVKGRIHQLEFGRKLQTSLHQSLPIVIRVTKFEIVIGGHMDLQGK